MSDSYQTIQDLIKDITESAQKLESGEMKPSEFDNLVEMSREVYERLVVVRYKLLTDSTPESSEPQKEEARPIPFPVGGSSKKGVDDNQTSLIDAIEQMSEEKDQEPNESEEPAPVAQEEEPEIKEDFTPEPAVQEDIEPSFADIQEKAPIEDLGKAISLNQKFLFINELFSGDSDKYASTINEINGQQDRSGAEMALGNVSGDWDMESESAQQLVELIHRRFPQ